MCTDRQECAKGGGRWAAGAGQLTHWVGILWCLTREDVLMLGEWAGFEKILI